MKLKEIADIGLLPGGPIITASEPEVEAMPIRMSNRWIVASGGSLFKRFEFENSTERNRFVREILDVEEEFGVKSTIKIVESEVMVALLTGGIGVITNRDREFANTVDIVFKDVIETTVSGVSETEVFLVQLGVSE